MPHGEQSDKGEIRILSGFQYVNQALCILTQGLFLWCRRSSDPFSVAGNFDLFRAVDDEFLISEEIAVVTAGQLMYNLLEVN